jgi:IclR family transcriptional regulator, acetate operon repressor
MARKYKPKLDSPAAKVMAMLDAVARMRAAPLSALASQLDIPTPTAHRICRELERLGWLQRLPGSRLWTVARPLVDLSANALAGAANAAPTHAVLRALTSEIGEMSSFAVQVDDEVVYVASAEPPQELTLSFRAGRKAPLFCTSSGRLFLARLDEASLTHYLEAAKRPAFTRYTVTDPKKLLAIISRVRAAGHAMTEQEYMLHVVGAGVPVIGPHDVFYGVLSVAAPDVRCSTKRLEQLLPVLKRAAARLAKHLAAPRAADGRAEAGATPLRHPS